MILADTNKWRGWVHVESVLPYSTNEQGPNYTFIEEAGGRLLKKCSVFLTNCGPPVHRNNRKSSNTIPCNSNIAKGNYTFNNRLPLGTQDVDLAVLA